MASFPSAGVTAVAYRETARRAPRARRANTAFVRSVAAEQQLPWCARYTADREARIAELTDRPLTDQFIPQAAAGNVQFKGRFADAMNNITFPG